MSEISDEVPLEPISVFLRRSQRCVDRATEGVHPKQLWLAEYMVEQFPDLFGKKTS